MGFFISKKYEKHRERCLIDRGPQLITEQCQKPPGDASMENQYVVHAVSTRNLQK